MKAATRRWAMQEVAKTVRLVDVKPPPKPRRGFWRDYIFNSANFFSTISIFGLIAIIQFSPGNIEIFDPIKLALNDFSFTDMVFSTWKEDSPVEENIVVVNLGSNRAEIGQQIRLLSAMKPTVIAVDAKFATEKEPDVDLPLMDAIVSAKSAIVFPGDLSDNSTKEDNKPSRYMTLTTAHPKFLLPNVSYGHMLLNADQEDKTRQTLRSFLPQERYRDTVLNSFAMEIAERYKPGITKSVMARGNEEEIINYRGSYNKFVLLDIDPSMPLDSAVAAYGSLVKGKIVMLGYMGQPFDNPNDLRSKFYTPVSKRISKAAPDMYGIILNANIVSMIIRDEMITQMPDWLGFVLAIVVCYLNMALFHWIIIRFPSFAGGEMKVIQLIQAGIIVGVTMLAMYNLRYDADIALSLAVVLLASDVLEIHESSVQRMLERLRETRR
jgi:CHASE2 domain-containing sensor protein